MRAIVLGIVVALVLAIGGGFVLLGFTQNAEETFVMPTVRLGPTASVEIRGGSGGERAG